MSAAEDAQIEQAKKDVASGRVQRIAVPGQWRVFKNEDGEVVVDRFAESRQPDADDT